jgi:hypothetical protein
VSALVLAFRSAETLASPATRASSGAAASESMVIDRRDAFRRFDLVILL